MRLKLCTCLAVAAGTLATMPEPPSPRLRPIP